MKLIIEIDKETSQAWMRFCMSLRGQDLRLCGVEARDVKLVGSCIADLKRAIEEATASQN